MPVQLVITWFAEEIGEFFNSADGNALLAEKARPDGVLEVSKRGWNCLCREGCRGSACWKSHPARRRWALVDAREHPGVLGDADHVEESGYQAVDIGELHGAVFRFPGRNPVEQGSRSGKVNTDQF